MHFSAARPRERGFVLVTVGVCLVAMMAMLGLAVDIGRMYIVRNESQAYVDAASLTAALQLDGTTAGISRAANTLSASTNRWNLGSTAFAGTQIDFGTGPTGPWMASPSPAAGYRFVRVRATSAVSLYFLPIVVSARTSVVAATAVAGQLPKTDFSEGVFPFSPFAHNNSDLNNFGYTPGTQYTLRWPASPKLNKNLCPGDNAQQWLDESQLGGNSERGYIEINSASVLRSIVYGDQTVHVTVGQPVTMTNGNKQTERDALNERVNQDTNPLATSYAQYESSGMGNSRRLVAVPINSGHPNNIVLGIALFFLLGDYPQQGNQPWCAEYVGPYVQGGDHQGAGGPGAYVVRLVQ
jgi:Flp pilus assembly protein TadG